MFWLVAITVIVAIWAIIASLAILFQIYGISEKDADADRALNETSSATLDDEIQHNSARGLVPNAAPMQREPS